MFRSLACLALVVPLVVAVHTALAVTLEEVAVSDRQWTGIGVSADGRIFVNFPRWSLEVPVSVGELQADGTVKPYPGPDFQDWQPGADATAKFVCVQSVHVDAANRLWILDPANAWLQGVIPGGAKLLLVDLKTDSLVRTYAFDETVAPPTSYLNDVRVDVPQGKAYLTDSSLGALVVLDLESGQARRVLEDHPATQAEDILPVIGGRSFPARIHADGIALDAAGGWLYWQALTGRTLYRVPTAALNDASLAADSLAAAVATFAESGVADGLLWTPEGILVSALEEGAIKRVLPQGKVVTVVQDERIIWPDSFAKGSAGEIYFTTAQIHLGPDPPTPYRILRIPPVPGTRPDHP